MASITGLTSARMLEIENASVVNGYIDELGHLILVTKAGGQIDAGPITTFLATEEAAGGVELATSTETLAGIDNQRAVTPAGLSSVIGSFTGYRYLGPVIFTSSGTFTKADYPGLKAVRVRTVGGGGGGGYSPAANTGNHSAGGGGGGGGYAEKLVPAASLFTAESVTIGAGGTAGTSGTPIGGTGGTSSFGAHAVATGGVGGESFGDASLAVAALGGAGGSGTAGTIMSKGAPGGMGSGYATLAHGGCGGPSMFGGGAVAVYTPAGSGAIIGNPGGNYGGGGGGGISNATGVARNGGAGGPGIVIVEVYV